MLLYAILFTQSTLNSVRPTEPSPIKIIKIFDRDDDDGTFYSAYRGHTPTFFLSQQFAKLWPIRETCLLSLSQLKACCTPFSCKKLKTRFFKKLIHFCQAEGASLKFFWPQQKLKHFCFCHLEKSSLLKAFFSYLCDWKRHFGICQKRSTSLLSLEIYFSPSAALTFSRSSSSACKS